MRLFFYLRNVHFEFPSPRGCAHNGENRQLNYFLSLSLPLLFLHVHHFLGGLISFSHSRSCDPSLWNCASQTHTTPSCTYSLAHGSPPSCWPQQQLQQRLSQPSQLTAPNSSIATVISSSSKVRSMFFDFFNCAFSYILRRATLTFMSVLILVFSPESLHAMHVLLAARSLSPSYHLLDFELTRAFIFGASDAI